MRFHRVAVLVHPEERRSAGLSAGERVVVEGPADLAAGGRVAEREDG